MVGVGHVQVDEDLEFGGLGQFVLDDRDRVLQDLDVLVDDPVVATKPNEGRRSLRGDHQRRGYRRSTRPLVEVLNKPIEFLAGMSIELLPNRTGFHGQGGRHSRRSLEVNFRDLETSPFGRSEGIQRRRRRHNVHYSRHRFQHLWGDLLRQGFQVLRPNFLFG